MTIHLDDDLLGLVPVVELLGDRVLALGLPLFRLLASVLKFWIALSFACWLCQAFSWM